MPNCMRRLCGWNRSSSGGGKDVKIVVTGLRRESRLLPATAVARRCRIVMVNGIVKCACTNPAKYEIDGEMICFCCKKIIDGRPWNLEPVPPGEILERSLRYRKEKENE